MRLPQCLFWWIYLYFWWIYPEQVVAVLTRNQQVKSESSPLICNWGCWLESSHFSYLTLVPENYDPSPSQLLDSLQQWYLPIWELRHSHENRQVYGPLRQWQRNSRRHFREKEHVNCKISSLDNVSTIQSLPETMGQLL